MTQALRIEVLGPFTASVDDQPVNLGGRQQRAVLAVLLLARGQLVPAQRIIEAVWADDPPPSAGAALQAYVSHLRRRLEPGRTARARDGVIVSEGASYALCVPEEAVDAWRFERDVHAAAALGDPAAVVAALGEALSLWGGPALHEYADAWWAQADARRLTELRTLARERLLQARLDLGEAAVLVPELETLIGDDPLREERWRLLVLALYRSHRQADALAALRRARQILVEELGVDPGPALRALEADVLAQSERLDAPEVAIPAGAPAVQPTAHEAPSDLVDRERELAILHLALEDVFDGRAGLVLVEGAAGIGKSRLLAEVRRQAGQRGATLLAARGSQLEKEYGFGAVRQLFDPLLSDPELRGALLGGAASSASGVFDATSLDHQHRVEGVFAVLHGLYWLTVNLAASRPVVIAVDDLQWCDTGSLRFLSYLVHRLEGMPVLVVATMRTGEQHDDEDLLAVIASDAITVTVSPTPLTVSGVGDLVRQRLGETTDDVFVATCHKTTSGNPLLVRQLLRALEAERVRPDALHADTVRAIGSRAVSSMVLMRFARMPAACRAVARAVSVLGDGASLPLVAAMTDLSDDEAGRAIAGLARAEVLRDEYPLGFVHPLVGDAVYGDLPPGERELQHERAARVLGAAGGSSEQIAAHLLLVASRGDAGVVRVLREAAQRDAERGAAESATAYLKRALQEPPSADALPEVLLELGRVETMGDGPSATEHLTAAYDLLAEPVRRAEVAIMLARTLVFAGERGHATAVARKALDALPRDRDDDRQALLALERISGYMHALDPESYDLATRPAVSGDGPGARALAAALAWELLCQGTERERAMELARFAVADGVLQSVDTGLLWVVAGLVLHMSGEDTMAFWDEALADAHARGALFAALGVHLWRGFVRLEHGDLREALQSFETCSEQNRLWGAPLVGQPYTDAFSVAALLERGDVAAARAVLEEARPRERFGEGVRLFGEAEAITQLCEGRPEEALRSLEAVQGHMAAVLNPVWRPWRSMRAFALGALGRVDEADRLVEEELEIARGWGRPETIGKTLRHLGLLRGDEALLREAVEVLDTTPAVLERSKALTDLGRLLLGRADAVPELREEGVAALRAALDLASACAADGLRRLIAGELAEAGVDVPAQPSATVCLTTTESRIAAMSIAGATDREIAQQLFITPRTVR